MILLLHYLLHLFVRSVPSVALVTALSYIHASHSDISCEPVSVISSAKEGPLLDSELMPPIMCNLDKFKLKF